MGDRTALMVIDAQRGMFETPSLPRGAGKAGAAVVRVGRGEGTIR